MIWHRESSGWGLAVLALASWGCQADVEPLVIESEIVVAVPMAGTPAAHQRLQELLRKGTQPGTMEPVERREVEELVLGLMPATEGTLSGHRWEIKYLDMPGVDFVSAELMRGEGTADRRVWMQLLPMKDKPLSGFEPGDLEPVAGYRARGMLDHHLFVRVGDFDLRIVADKPETRDDAYLRQILLGCRLDEIASL